MADLSAIIGLSRGEAEKLIGYPVRVVVANGAQRPCIGDVPLPGRVNVAVVDGIITAFLSQE